MPFQNSYLRGICSEELQPPGGALDLAISSRTESAVRKLLEVEGLGGYMSGLRLLAASVAGEAGRRTRGSN
jgi:hypothetical protein